VKELIVSISTDRTAKLQAMLAKNPSDPFLVYALGMEHKKTDPAEAIKLFEQAIQLDANQSYAYFQLGQTNEATGNLPAARTAYERGMAAASRSGDAHARQEIEAALDALGPS
jgi:tetratricopeptide (TPR) repeat protein